MQRRRLATLCTLLLAGGFLVSVQSSASAVELASRTVMLRATPSSPHSGTNVVLSGSLTNSPSGSSVRLQQLKSGSWSTLTTRSISSTGTYSYSFAVSTTGERVYRAYAPATSKLAAATSPSRSITVLPKPKTPFSRSYAPTVSGTTKVGSTLTATVTPWSPVPASYSYQWRRDGAKITGATGTAYELVAADRGTYVTVEVSATRSGSLTVKESKTSTPISAGSIAPGSPTISGEPVVGGTLTAQPGAWTPTPSFAFQWARDGTPIPGAIEPQYSPAPADQNTSITVRVTGSRDGYADATATSEGVTVKAPQGTSTFGDLMQPTSRTALPSSVASVEASSSAPFTPATRVRWDEPNSYAHSLKPQPFGTMAMLYTAFDFRDPDAGAEYHVGNGIMKNADVEFVATGKNFAIRYLTRDASDATVWIDGQPASPSIAGSESGGEWTVNWIVVTLPESRTVTVRFAGPVTFSGVEFPTDDPVTITEPPRRYTVGIISDSFFEPLPANQGASGSGAITLASLTGFRVWNMAQGGSGYIKGGPWNTPFGSSPIMTALREAPIDVLLVNGSLNDVFWPVEEHRAAVDQFLNDVAEARPGLPVVLVGVEPISIFGLTDEPHPRPTGMTENLASAADRHDNVVGFIDPYTENWLTGTGSTADPKGDGNQDTFIGPDGVHANAAGQAFYQGKIAAALRNIPRPTP